MRDRGLIYLLMGFLGVIGFGTLNFQRDRALTTRRADSETGRRLAAISSLKVSNLEQWRRERLASAEALVANEPLQRQLQRLVQNRATKSERESLLRWLTAFCQSSEYLNGIVTDASGQVKLAYGPVRPSSHHYLELTQRASALKRPFLRDFHSEGPLQTMHLGLNMALGLPGQAEKFGALLLAIDPTRTVFTVIASWPEPGESGETVLIRREGNSAKYLLEGGRGWTRGADLNEDFGQTQSVAVQAASGATGFLRGTDRSGAPVLAWAAPVPSTPWIVVTQVGEANLRNDIFRRALRESLELSAVLAVSGLGLYALWRHLRARNYRTLYEKERSRREALTRYETMLRLANDAIVLTTTDGVVVEANDRAAELYGYSREHWIGRQVQSFRPPEDAGDIQRDWEGEIGPEGRVYETRHVVADGKVIDVEISMNVVHLHGERYRQVLIRDISRRLAAERSLQKTTEVLHALVQASPVAIVSTDVAGRVTSWNPAAERVFGWTVEEALNGSASPVPDETDAIEQTIRDLALAGRSCLGVSVVRSRRNGDQFPARLSCAPIRDEKGSVSGLMALVEDISQEREYQDALTASESRFRRLVENAPIGVFIERALRFDYLNPAALSLCGASCAGDLLGTNVFARIHPAGHAELAAQMHGLANEEPQPTIELDCLRLDGTVFPAQISAVSVRDAAGPATLVFFTDVSERRRAEQQIRQMQRLESVGRLAGGVAHDFNNHLNVIIGYCELLASQLGATHSLQPFVEEIRKAGERSAGLTRQLLAFSRRTRAQPKVLDLNRVLKEFESMLRRMLGERVDLRLFLAPEPIWVFADAGQLEQVIMNVAVNARDAMPEGGRLEFAIGQSVTAPVGAGGEGPWATIRATDTGTGMDEATRLQVFEPFFTTKPIGVGTGLGLSTVYGIVRGSGGWVEVESELGRGTTFQFWLPLTNAGDPVEEAESASRTSEPTNLVRNGTVLVIEDHEQGRELMTRFLRGHGYEVADYPGGSEALEAAVNLKPCAAIVDVRLPGMSGPDVADQLRKINPDLPIVFVSGYADPSEMCSVKMDGLGILMDKPLRFADLLRVVDSLALQTYVR